jgi:A/G-specific adenine glycosylase
VLRWQAHHGRHDLPWQHPRTPYRVWLSEVMLQQTQVATVIPYFEKFLARFPTLAALAAAPLDDVLTLWSGLGYYSRARNLHRCAELCVERHGGELPDDVDVLMGLPGIGRSTAGAIVSQAHDRPTAILDGNVRRLLIRYHALAGDPHSTAMDKQLWALAESHLPPRHGADYSQALMDLGATVCTPRAPNCPNCPLQAGCAALALDRVDTLPEARTRKAVPERASFVLVLVDRAQRAVLLEQRPPIGVWAGLWTPPLEEDRDALLDRHARHRHRDATATDLPAFVHVFSHFRLLLSPILQWAEATPTASAGDNAAQRWQPLARLDEIGLPSPMRRLLDAVAAELSPDAPPARPPSRLRKPR